MLKGKKTLIFNGLAAMGVALLHFVVGVDLTSYMSASTAAIVLTVANIGLRFLTSTPALKKE